MLQMSEETIINQLSKTVNKDVLRELLKEYDLAKRAHYVEDWEKSILHASKFSEICLAVVKNIIDKETIDINSIHFDRLFSDLNGRKKTTAHDDILMLAIPKTATSVYCIRNKKRVAHVKSINPDLLDSTYCISACDWILAQFLMLFVTDNPNEANSLIHSLIEKQVPFVEQFEDGSLFVLKENLSFKEQLLIALYKLGRRVMKKELASFS